MRKKIAWFCVLILVFSYTTINVGNVKAAPVTNTSEDYFSYPIYSQETGEEIGIKLLKTTTTEEKISEDEKLVTITSEIESTYKDSTVENTPIETSTTKLLYKNNKLYSINGEVSSDFDSLDISLNQNDYKKIEPLAAQFNQGELSFDDYLSEVAKLELDIVKEHENQLQQLTNPTGFSILGGLSYVTYYSKSSKGGYNLQAAQMYNKNQKGIAAIMLDYDAVKPNTMRYKHNYLNSHQGGLVSSFLIRADNVSSARTELLILGASLIGSLGVTVLTAATIAGAIVGTGTAAGIATRMMIVSNNGHNDIVKAYDLIKIINTQ